MKQQFITMLEMQDRMNKKVHPQWIEQNFEWYRALWLECGELIDHHGYKWWKKQTPDMEQLRLEIIDIWHFGMSMLFDGRDIETIAMSMVEDLEGQAIAQSSILDATEALAGDVLNSREFSPVLFWSLLKAADMDMESLYSGYVGKNVLNFFRQDNGYKEGDYIKQWHGREDNEHLVEVIAEMDSSNMNFAADLYNALAARYIKVTEEVT